MNNNVQEEEEVMEYENVNNDLYIKYETINKYIIIYKNGDTYEGFVKDYKKEGMGKMSYDDGKIYIGNWKNNLRNDEEGKLIINENEYISNWKNDKSNNYGKIKYKNGDEYEGNWNNNFEKIINLIIFSTHNIIKNIIIGNTIISILILEMKVFLQLFIWEN